MASAEKKIQWSKTINGAFEKFYDSELAVYKPEYLSELDNSRLAQSIAQTQDKKSNAYKAAIRNIQRWKQGTRRPSKESQGKIIAYIRRVPDLAKELFLPDRNVGVRSKFIDEYENPPRSRDTGYVAFSPADSIALWEQARTDEYGAQETFFEVWGYVPAMISAEYFTVRYA